MKLSKSNATVVQDAMANTRDGAGLSFREFIAYWIKYDVKPAVKNLRGRHATLSDQELEWKARFGWISDWPNGWYLRGMARRLSTDNLDEFGLFLQMHVRQAVLNHTSDEDEFTEVWPLLHALAIRDTSAIDRFIKNASFPLKAGHPDTRLIFNCVQALLRSDTSKAKALLKKRASGKTPAWLEGMIDCLEGILAEDAAQVASGLEQHLDGFKKASKINPLEKIISLEAHGLYRLAERIDPKLVAEVDTQRKLPWDQDFHDWSSSHQPVLTMTEFGRCPRPLASAFVNFERPEWMS
jgi:hypothetical protein